MSQKAFLHCDLDAFFASVEQLDNPLLRGKPVIVGGTDDRRSVVCTASYEARKYGVHSAMPQLSAKRLCPDGIFLPVRMERYKEISNKIMQIFNSYSPDVQQMSIDEAFIDLTGTEKLFGRFEETAKRLKKEVFEKTGLTVSVGLASNKYIAKIASGMNKPNGFYFVPFGEEEKFMRSLPLEKIWGLGKKTLEKLHSKCINTTERLFNSTLQSLQQNFGKSTGEFLYNAVRGKEYERFNIETKNHSISNEVTFPYDLRNINEIKGSIYELCELVMKRLWKENLISCTVCVKIRFGDFSTITVSKTYDTTFSSIKDLSEKAIKLFETRFVPEKGLRLLGISLQNVVDESKRVLTLFDEEDNKLGKVEKTIFEVESKIPGIKIISADKLIKKRN